MLSQHPKFVTYVALGQCVQNGNIISGGADPASSLEGVCRFHVDDLSSAHVYLRLPKGQEVKDIPDETLEDCCQLVKANSIQGNKVDNLSIVYTLVSNLKKTTSMEIGQVQANEHCNPGLQPGLKVSSRLPLP